MRSLLEAMCPDMRGRTTEINTVARLRSATATNLDQRVRKLGRLVRAKAATEDATVACVFVHEDLDEPDGDRYPITRERVQKALESEFVSAHYVLAVAEIEAWLLLFPQCLERFAKGWQVPARRRGGDSGLLRDPKQTIKREVSTQARRYSESDCPVLFDSIAQRLTTREGSNRSWDQFERDVATCCGHHLGA